MFFLYKDFFVIPFLNTISLYLLKKVIENGLTPVMALRACQYPCHKSCIYRHLHNILDKVCDMRVDKIVDEYNIDVEVIEENEKVAENNNLSTRRQLFTSPHSSDKYTSMENDVI